MLGFLILSFNVGAAGAAETLEINLMDKAVSSMGLSTGLLAVPSAVPSRTIMYSIRPLALIGREVLGNHARHLTLLPPGVTPHDYVLKISDIERLKQADVVVWMGPDIEPYLSKIISRLVTNQQHTIVINVSDGDQVPGIKLLAIEKTLDHKPHQDEGEESSDITSAGYDPHLWLSPANARAIAGTIIKKIEHIDPDSKKEMELNFKLFEEKMNFINFKDYDIRYKPYVVYHNAFIYLENYLQIKNSGAITDQHHSKAGLRHIVHMAETINSENIACIISPLNSDEKLVKKVFGGNQFNLTRLDLMADMSKEDALYTKYLLSLMQDLKACIEYELIQDF